MMGHDAKSMAGLTGQVLVAMPQMEDERFARSVVYVVAHSQNGAMGLVLNRLVEAVSFPSLLEQLGVECTAPDAAPNIHFGGPVETQRGFVLHSADYRQESTVNIRSSICITATVEILRDIADGCGPECSILALGYAGWAPGQLEAEIQHNGWLHVPADTDLVFHTQIPKMWQTAIAKLGFDPFMLSTQSGHA